MLKTHLKKEERERERQRERKRRKDKRVKNVELFQENSISNSGGELLYIIITFTEGRVTLRERESHEVQGLKECSQGLHSESFSHLKCFNPH